MKLPGGSVFFSSAQRRIHAFVNPFFYKRHRVELREWHLEGSWKGDRERNWPGVVAEGNGTCTAMAACAAVPQFRSPGFARLPHPSPSPSLSLSRERALFAPALALPTRTSTIREKRMELKARNGPSEGGYLGDSQLLSAEETEGKKRTKVPQPKRKKRKTKERERERQKKKRNETITKRQQLILPPPLVKLVLIRVAILSPRRRRINRVLLSWMLV